MANNPLIRRQRFAPGVLAGLALVGLTVAAFGPVRDHEFVNYDDPAYVTNNRHVKQGLTAENVWWAWTAVHSANWHPLTWLSLQLDSQLYGMDPAGFHLINLVLHAANVLLLFLVLQGMTGALWRSAAVAALFAVHPLHVESVAWVAERKDVLSTFFGLLALLAYERYARAPGWGRYLLVLLGLALSLLAKPMLVTLPFVLLLLDWWPLRRWQPGGPGAEAPSPPGDDRASPPRFAQARPSRAGKTPPAWAGGRILRRDHLRPDRGRVGEIPGAGAARHAPGERRGCLRLLPPKDRMAGSVGRLLPSPL